MVATHYSENGRRRNKRHDQGRALTFELRTTTDPAKRRQITDNIATFSNAANLMVARYEMIAANQLEKASVAALKIAVDVITKVLIAAL